MIETRGPRAMLHGCARLWTCAVCKRTFEEALHPKEALDTDQHYYEKFDRRYCGMDCLGAHRRAGFRPDFVLS